MAKTFGLFLLYVCLLTVQITINMATAQHFGSTSNLCEEFLTDKNLISLITETKDAATPCACAEYDMAQDALFEKVGTCYEEWLLNDGVKQRCCYSENGKLLTGYSDNRFGIPGGIGYPINEIHDSCCNNYSQSSCDAFYEITKKDDCQRHQDQLSAYSWGDPVIETVSNTAFSFNGHGEYVFLKSYNTLEIQARTDYLIANSTDSTIFTAFVFTIYPQRQSIHVIFNRTSMNLNLYDNKGNLKTNTSSLCNPRQPLMTEAYVVLCSNTTSALGFKIVPKVKLSNVNALVTIDKEFMNIRITYSKELANMTGLAGNVQDGFYVLPNGTKYSVNSSESLMFEYGESWSLRNNPTSSNFWYNLTGGDFNFYNNKSRPRFLENLLDKLEELFKDCNKSMISAFKNTCQNSWDNQTNKECMLTIARTCNMTLGKAIHEQVERQRNELQRKSNKPPTFMASMPNETTLIYKGNSSWILNLLDHVQDENRTGLRFEVAPNLEEIKIVGGVFNWTVGTALRRMNLSDNSIRFVVYDQFNMSETHSVRIRYCGCEDPSDCEFQNDDDDNAECKCRNRFVEGLFCDHKRDPCSEYVCYKNDTCNKTYLGDGSPCAVCPLGFYKENLETNQICRDLNECNDTRIHNCEQECINDVGSYHCACKNGYLLNNDNFTCADVNECVLGNYSCPNPHEECVNLPGTYTCGCASGYRMFNTTSFCVKLDCGEVNPPINGTISRGATTYGSVVTITCNSGHKLIGNNTSLCQHTGIWSHENFTCKYVDCGPLHKPLGGYVTPLDTSYGTLASIKCNIGYQLFGNDTSFCDTDGNWTSTNFTCNIIDCGRPPEIKNGKMNFSATVFQSNANVMCDTGYVLSRSNTFLICLSNGSWSFYEFQCNPVDCGVLTTRGHQQITYAGNKTTFGTQAIMVCDIGYRRTNRPGVQSEAAVCNASGHWSIPHFSTCESIVCPSLNISGDEMDMNATTKGPYTANMSIQFTCKAGFTVNGYDNIICLSNGKWSGETPKCMKENKVYPNCTKKENQSWDETSPGGIRTQPCPGNAIGVVSRTCYPKGEWMQPVDGCVRKEIETISLQIEAIKYNPTQESITYSLNQLSNVTNISQNEQGENKVNTISVTSGELEKVTHILDTIVNASANINITDVTNNQVQKFLQTTSNILDASNTDSWKSIEQNNNNQNKSAVKVLQVVDRYIGVISKYINSSQNGSITVNTTNLDASSFSVVVYKNLSGILSSNTVDNTSDAKSVISSEVISVNLDNWQSNPNFNISLTLAYFQTNSGQPKCTFWNMSRSAWDTNGCTLAIQRSNSSMCVCNHLTNFAILMSPWTENVDTTALDVISIVGCSISMLGLIITVVVHFHLWRYVRSDRVVILMNLSIALISSYAVFIGGVDRTENKALCTAIAVLLQYIYLVVFFLMLAEGIDIGITVLYVFVTKSRLKWILPAAWALPAVIVGVSMGATKLEGYGNTKFCWLSMEGGLIWAFVAPAMLIILVNFVVLILVIRTMFRSKTLSEKSRSERSKAGVRCLCVLLPLMGCTWVIGLLYVNESMAWVQYVFAVCNSLQGLVIFVFHCVLNVQIRNALLRRKHRKQSKSFISTNSASLVSTRVTEEPFALPKINLSTAKRTPRGSLHSADDATGTGRVSNCIV